MLLDLFPPEIWEGLRLGLHYLYIGLPIWLPAVFLISAFRAWLYYRRIQTWRKEGHVLLEIRLPKEILKSPAAMEIVLGAFFQGGGETTWIDRIWKGQTRPWFSLELVSTEGKVRFFIWTKPKFRNVIESAIYSQYPGVEIYEAEDYTKPFYYDPLKTEIWGSQFILTGADPVPIKTYVDYGMVENPKEEFKIDPMTPILEFLGSLTSGQNIWIQIIIRAHKKRRLADVFGEKEDAWKQEAEKQVKDILEKMKASKEEGGFPRIPTKVEADTIGAIQRSVTKLPFDTTIRAIYITEKDKFNPNLIGGVAGGFKQFGSANLNGFKPAGWMNIFDYPWQEWFNAKEKLKPKVLEEYKLRRFFFSPFQGKKFYTQPFVLNTEELATIFHFPGAVAGTPTLPRVESKKSEAPPNLPL